MWTGFSLFVVAMLALDLGVFHRRAHVVKTREAIAWTVVWITLALIFNAGVWHFFGSQRALEFLSGYLVEKSLSVDNLFVFIVIFSYFSVPSELQHRVLFWGVLGALVMRALFIGIGAVLLQNFHWVIYPFGILLLWTGGKLFFQRSSEVRPHESPFVRLFQKWMPFSSEYSGSRFFVIKNGKRFGTPLLLALITIEVTDVIFAVDSIPAIFAITSDPFIVFSSNIFAILGLRSLYFALKSVMDRFHYLRIGLAVILSFIGTKMLLTEVVKIPIIVSLVVIACVLALSVLMSIIYPKVTPPLPKPIQGNKDEK